MTRRQTEAIVDLRHGGVTDVHLVVIIHATVAVDILILDVTCLWHASQLLQG